MAETNLFGLLSAAIVSVAVFASMDVLARGIVRSRGGDEMIRVTGSARKPIRSDFIIWSGHVAYQGTTIAETYGSLKASSSKVVKYLMSNGVPAGEIVTQAVQTKPLYQQTKQANGDGGNQESTFRPILGYELSQAIEVRSHNVDLVDKLSRQVTDLIATGVPFESNPPQFLYTKLSEVKVEILAEAAQDARHRAEQIARSSGASLSSVRFARMSPLQITPLYSNEISAEGQNDTTSLDKAITAIVSMGFGVN